MRFEEGRMRWGEVRGERWEVEGKEVGRLGNQDVFRKEFGKKEVVIGGRNDR